MIGAGLWRASAPFAREPWFVATDVCAALGVGNHRMTVDKLDDDEKMTLASTEGHSGQRGAARSILALNCANPHSGFYNCCKTDRQAVVISPSPSMKKFFASLVRLEGGATAAEYALIAVLVGLTIIVGVMAII